MNHLRLYILVFSCLLPMVSHCQYASKKKAGDMIESTSYNDHKRGTARKLCYKPDGEDFVCVNGNYRYTRALYGSHTAWRLETSDRPIFATYVKRDCRNIRFRLHMPDGKNVIALDGTTWCEARYTPGRRSYILKDERWGKDASLSVSVLTSQTIEKAVWKITSIGMPEGCVLEVINSPIRRAKLSRSGDMGADPADSFDPSEDGKIYQRIELKLPSDALSASSGDGSTKESTPLYVAIESNNISHETDTSLYDDMEKARKLLASRISIVTPDPYLNTLGGALAIAADGIWGEEGVWLHGAVGWRMPLSGWRAAYTGDALGWHDRARIHFDNYAASQVTDVPCVRNHPAQDSALALARSVKQWGTPQYSNGYICRNPNRNNQMHHYDMNLCYIDELLWHLDWTGDIEYARKMWPVLTRHLAWEKLNYDPDGDGLYDAYACIWASDALYYNSGAVTHSSAYNYRANMKAASIARLIGEDPAPYQEEADKILSAMNSRLWLQDKGYWAEFQDFMGHRRLHESAGVWTIYHAIDSETADPFQAYLATCYIDNEIPHIPVRAEGLPDDGYATISTTSWLPYSWSINNVAFAEVMHTALAYFQAGRAEEGYKLMKSSILDGMYLGESPANFGQISFYDAARGECYRDFGDPIGVASRLLVQGLYGVLPDAMNGKLLIKPGFPEEWKHASLHTPDVDIDFMESEKTTFRLTHRLSAVKEMELQFHARYSEIKRLTVNGCPVEWKSVENAIRRPMVSVTVEASFGTLYDIEMEWGGMPLSASDSIDTASVKPSEVHMTGKFAFAQRTEGQMKWWVPLALPEKRAIDKALTIEPFRNVDAKKCKAVDMNGAFNSNVTDIFRNEYLSPRSPYTTLQIPKQGIGEWCHPLKTAEIDDSGLRASVRNGMIDTPMGILFRTPSEGYNIAFTSLWDNYPDSVSIALEGKASHAYLLMAGSTNHMQCNIDNGVVRVYYKDGTCDVMPLVNPYNWPPIEQLFFEDGKAFNRNAPSLWRLRLKTGEASDRFGETMGYQGVTREVDGGAAVLLDIPLDKSKRLSHLMLETLSNEVVIGIMAITLQR